MAISTALWSFALVVGLLTLTPGLDTALVLRTAAVGHRRRAWGVVLGIQTSTLTWGVLSSAGVTAVLTASQIAYDVLRWAGAAYLLWMGGRMVLATLRRRRGRDSGGASGGDSGGASAGESAGAAPALPAGTPAFAAGWRQGALTNLLNPKIGVFYVAVLPQFIPEGAPHFATGVLLTLVHVLLGAVWSTVLIGCARAVGGWLRRPAARAALDRVTGTVIVGFGVHLALSE